MSASEILSQEEIDALLDKADSVASQSGKGSGSQLRDEVEPYDIFRPDPGSRGMPDLQSLPEDLARGIDRGLEPPLGDRVKVRLAAEPDMQPFGDYVKSIATPCAIGVGAIDKLADPVLLILDAQAVRSLVDVLFGGDGNCGDARAPELTGTELRVATRVLKRIGQILAGIVDPQASYLWRRVETNASSALGPPARAQIASLSYELGLGGGLRVGLLREDLEQICGSGRFMDGAAPDEASFGQRLVANTTGAPLEVHARVAELQLSVRDLLGLSPGDFIPADISRNVVLHVDSCPILHGVLGISGSMNAVHISGPAGDIQTSVSPGKRAESTGMERR